jgi:LysR family hydrogen peroxide-inducible transcriptional activator
MDLRQLSALVAIADHGSFSAAARALYTVQSNVSGHIAHLERELGATLVDRQRGGLTEAGAAVVERARRIQREFESIAADMASRDSDVAGLARIGTIGTTGRWSMPQVLTKMRDDHPKVRLIVVEGPTSSLVQRLVEGELDAAVVHLPVQEPELAVIPMFVEDLMVLAHSNHELGAHEEASLATVARYPLLLPPSGTALRRVIDRAASSAGVVLRPLAEIDGVRLLASMAFEGFGPSIVPATAVPRWLRGDFRRVRVPELPQRVVGWANRRRPALTAPARAVREVMIDLIGRVGERQPGVHVDALSLERISPN